MTVLVDESVVLASDGVASLVGDVWRPAASRRYPTVLVRTPYGRELARQQSDPLVWARQGWAVVHQDVRGRMASTGAFEPFVNERADAICTLDWICDQEWSDGRVVMMGPSYVGLTQWLAADSGHPALRGLAPTTTMHDPIRWFSEGGTPRRGFLAWWAAGFAATAPDPATAGQGLTLAGELLTDRPGSGWDARLAALFPPYAGWLSGQPAIPDVNEPRQLRPAIHLVGWHDLFCEDSLASYSRLNALATGRPDCAQRLIVGPWTHVGVGMQNAGELDYGPLASGLLRGVPAETHAFLAAAVAGDPAPSGVSVFVMGANVWRDLESWPPQSQQLRARLSPGMTLELDQTSSVSDRTSLDLSWQHREDDPVPSIGGRTLGPDLLDVGPRDQRGLLERADVHTFISAPLRADLTVIGELRLRVCITSDGEHDLVVRLCDVWPDGRLMSVVEHANRLPAGDRVERDLVVGSTAQTFSAGHRIALQVAASSWPRLATTPSCTITLHVGADCGLVLPVCPA